MLRHHPLLGLSWSRNPQTKSVNIFLILFYLFTWCLFLLLCLSQYTVITYLMSETSTWLWVSGGQKQCCILLSVTKYSIRYMADFNKYFWTLSLPVCHLGNVNDLGPGIKDHMNGWPSGQPAKPLLTRGKDNRIMTESFNRIMSINNQQNNDYFH